MRTLPILLLLACGPRAADDLATDEVDSGETGTADSGDSGEVDVAGAVRLASDAGGADLAIASDGAIYASWVAGGDIWVARSTDGGESFGAAVQADGSTGEAVAGRARKPYLAVRGQRLAVVWSTPNPNPTVYAAIAEDRDSLDFATPVPLGAALGAEYTDFPKGAFDPDGELLVAWHPNIGSDHWIAVAREGNGFAAEDATTGLPGEPCECCPLDVRVTAAGEAVVAYRNNESNIRNMWVSVRPASGGAFAPAEATGTDWYSEICPMEGPRLAELADGSGRMAWAETTGDGWRVFTARTDGSWSSWTGEALAADGVGGVQSRPVLAVDDEDREWLVFETFEGTWLVKREAGQSAFGAAELVDVDGRVLADVELASAAGITALVGTTAQGEVWLRRYE